MLPLKSPKDNKEERREVTESLAEMRFQFRNLAHPSCRAPVENVEKTKRTGSDCKLSWLLMRLAWPLQQ